jgi:uncharacterized membrane protein YoaK (UPF0700 family)
MGCARGDRLFQRDKISCGFMAVMLFSAYQEWGGAMVPLLTGLLRVAVVPLGGWSYCNRLTRNSFGYFICWPSALCFGHRRWL